jgi:DNA-directed RNA polymerase subunit RPC12/RpoP
MANTVKKTNKRKVVRKLLLIPSKCLPEYKCPFCGNEWNPRKARPVVCPACHRRLKWKAKSKSK